MYATKCTILYEHPENQLTQCFVSFTVWESATTFVLLKLQRRKCNKLQKLTCMHATFSYASIYHIPGVYLKVDSIQKMISTETVMGIKGISTLFQ